MQRIEWSLISIGKVWKDCFREEKTIFSEPGLGGKQDSFKIV